MIRAFYHSGAGKVTLDLPAIDWHAALHDPRDVLWVDFDAALPVEVEPLLRDTFGFHVLAIDDALCQTHVPKIDDWGDYIYAVVHSVIFNLESLAVTTHEFDIFLGLNYLVTYHHQPIDAVERLWRHVDQDRRELERGPDYLLYLLLDVLTAAYMPTIDALDSSLDALETTVFMQPTWIWVGLTVGLALVGVVLWGTLSGSMLPFIMQKLGVDPAARRILKLSVILIHCCLRMRTCLSI